MVGRAEWIGSPAAPALCVEAPVKLKQNPIALLLPTTVAALLVFGRYVVQCMTDNPWFPAPFPDLGIIANHLDDLEAAELTARTRGQGTAAARDDTALLVLGDLNALLGYVGWIISQNPGQATTITESAGLKPKRYTKPQKPALRAFLGPSPGEIRVEAKSAGRGTAYEWQYSTDGGQTWVTMAVTTRADTSLAGVPPGTTYLFRFRATQKGVTTDWSATVSLTVT